MNRYISFLRGINVGGHRKILMKDLKLLYADLGFDNISTYIQSGNVMFNSSSRASVEAHCERISHAIKEQYGYDVPVIIRSKEEFLQLASKNPYSNEDILKLHVTFLSEIPTKEGIEKIDQSKFHPDVMSFDANHIFLKVEQPYHKSKLTNKVFESKLNVSATNRNWKTYLKLCALLE